MIKDDPYRAFCENRKQLHQFRVLEETQILSDGHAKRDKQNLINFASNDYLGLSQNEALRAKALSSMLHDGMGSTASRLITGNTSVYTSIESRLAKGKGTEAALIMNSGYQANLSVLAALADRHVTSKEVVILADRLCHNSLLQGALLSGARLTRFQHNDYSHLQKLLQQQDLENTHLIIVSESVFGMDGDRADLPELIKCAEQYKAMLYIDEAHATGLFGNEGFGLTSDYQNQIDVIMGTFGKALGSFGAYIACKASIRDYLVQCCGGLIYSTALPPSVLGSIEAALELIPKLGNERLYLEGQAEHLRHNLRQQGWDCGKSTTHIIPILLKSEETATALASELKKKGLLVPAIRPPTVPPGTSRLRISLSAAHKEKDIDYLSEVMAFLAQSQNIAIKTKAS